MKKALVPAFLLALGAAAVLRAHPGAAKKDAPLRVSGTIEARDVSVGSLVGGRVESVAVEEGAAVAKGAVLVTLEANLLDLTIREQKGRVDEARAHLALVKKGPRREELARARADFANADADRKRYEALLAKGVVSTQQTDAMKTSAETKRQLLVELENGSRVEDLSAAAASLEREESRLAYLLRQREEMVVRAPAAGVIQSLDLRPGDLVAANQPMARLLEPSQTWIRVYVPETRISRVAMGARAGVTVDGAPGRVFSARVVEIGARAEYTPRNVQTLEQRSDTVSAVKLAIEENGALKPGMAATATLETLALPGGAS